MTKTYGRGAAAIPALRSVNLSIEGGESIAVIGRSGSGKSTLMHVLALLDKPTQGTVLIGGRDASGIEGREADRIRNRSYGFVFQQFYLNGRDTVIGNVMLPLVIAGVGRRQRKERALRALRSVGLEEKARNRATELSGGQKQRVCIARALVSDPSIIFADEPTGNLDSDTGAGVEDLLFRLNREHGITLVIVTYDQDLAAADLDPRWRTDGRERPMKAIDVVMIASSNMLRAKTRTLLTIIAIFIGALTITLTNGMGTGVEGYLNDQLGGLGATDVLFIQMDGPGT
ncbi:MAG: ATP-binding cassette domain-containing protein, partial [Candidatus Dormibacteraceae bacterium]